MMLGAVTPGSGDRGAERPGGVWPGDSFRWRGFAVCLGGGSARVVPPGDRAGAQGGRSRGEAAGGVGAGGSGQSVPGTSARLARVPIWLTSPAMDVCMGGGKALPALYLWLQAATCTKWASEVAVEEAERVRAALVTDREATPGPDADWPMPDRPSQASLRERPARTGGSQIRAGEKVGAPISPSTRGCGGGSRRRRADGVEDRPVRGHARVAAGA
jgi:hypothetical protein